MGPLSLHTLNGSDFLSIRSSGETVLYTKSTYLLLIVKMCLENFYFHGPRGRSFIHALTFKKRSYKFSLFCDSHMGIVWTSQIFLMFRRLWNHLFSSSQNTFPVSESRLRDNKVHDYMDTVVVSVLWYPPLSVPKRMSVPRTISDPGRPDV